MSLPIAYDRTRACEYAATWAMHRNPQYYDFSHLGGDCTNFISQCLLAGGGVMNNTPTFGWYYYDLQHRAPAWSGARYLYNFLLTNRAAGPVAQEIDEAGLEPGDVVFLSDNNGIYHSLFVSAFDGKTPLVTTHSFDAYCIHLFRYPINGAKFMHILQFQR